MNAIKCYGDGSVRVITSNPAGVASYSWSNSTSTTDITTGVCGGTTIYVTVTDNNGVEIDSMFTMPQPLLLEITDVTVTDVSCNGDSDGHISITIAGGSGGYTTRWYSSDNVLIKTEATAGLSSLEGYPTGDYTVRITDGNIVQYLICYHHRTTRCTRLTVVPTQKLPDTPTGTATVTNITGGNGGETITWYNGGGDNIGSGLNRRFGSRSLYS